MRRRTTMFQRKGQHSALDGVHSEIDAIRHALSTRITEGEARTLVLGVIGEQGKRLEMLRDDTVRLLNFMCTENVVSRAAMNRAINGGKNG